MSQDKHRHFGTSLIHFGAELDGATGAASVPIYAATTFHQRCIDEPQQYDYSRFGNPTRETLEKYIAVLENGAHGFAYSSGMAAISSAFLLLSAGDHVIVTDDVYGGTYCFLTDILARFNIEVSFVNMTDFNQVTAARKPNTKAVYMETPSNPILQVTDIRKIASWAKEQGLLSLIDNTFMTPYHQKPLELGVDIVLHSATKFLGGHSDVLAGLAVTNDEQLAKQMKSIQIGFGAVLNAHEAWMLMRGMKTLQVRMMHNEQSARKLAVFLSNHPKIVNVYYPGLPDHPGRAVHESQASGYGAVVSFETATGEQAVTLMKNVKIPIVAVSLGAVESILSYPAQMSHASMPREERYARGITDGLMRYSVGLEHVDDLIADLEAALKLI